MVPAMIDGRDPVRTYPVMPPPAVRAARMYAERMVSALEMSVFGQPLQSINLPFWIYSKNFVRAV